MMIRDDRLMLLDRSGRRVEATVLPGQGVGYDGALCGGA